ncbi:MAG: nitrate reductase molybdenum cofactor assembly chaperone [Alsobacter sp.]
MSSMTFRALSALLVYPSVDLIAAIPELRAALDADGLVPAAERVGLGPLLDEIEVGDIYDLQEAYGLLFDRSRALSLHLFEHIHGESRDRGQAMVDLLSMYQKAGLSPHAGELPDFLPLFLEFLSTQPLDAARSHLAQTAHILEAIGERLRKRRSSYAAIFDALCALAQAEPDRADVDALMQGPDPDPMDLVALDAAWEEEEVRFGPGAQSATGSCSGDGLIARMRHARRAVQNETAATRGGQ